MLSFSRNDRAARERYRQNKFEQLGSWAPRGHRRPPPLRYFVTVGDGECGADDSEKVSHAFQPSGLF